jgi:hypothetical protein
MNGHTLKESGDKAASKVKRRTLDKPPIETAQHFL